jgi:GNAT superfamily N-acetyltransferase
VSGEFELRRGERSDVDAIRRLVREAYAKWIPLIGREPKPMTADYHAAIEAHRFDLAHLDGALVGLIETVDEGEVLLVENVAIAPDFQGRGLGSRLLTHADGLARSLGRERLRLYTNKRFTENIRLYLRLGYAAESEEDVGQGTIRVHMSKTLASTTAAHGAPPDRRR